ELAVFSLGEVVTRVGGDEGGDIGSKGLDTFEHGVGALDDRLDSAYGLRRQWRDWLALHVELVEEGNQARDVVCHSAGALPTLGGGEAGVDNGHVPAREGGCSSHGERSPIL